MMYLDYNRFRSLVDEYFERFRGSPEISERQVNRDFGYFDIIRFFGSEAVDPAEIGITYQAEPFEFSDDRMARFAVEIQERMTAEGRELLMVRRAAHLASLEASFSPSVAGSVEYVVGGANLLELVHGSLAAETSEEMGLAPSEYQCVPLAYAREIFRGERPQLFGAILTHLAPTELTARLERLDPKVREFDDYEFLPFGIDGVSSGRLADQLNFEGRMNLELLSQYYRTQKG